MIKSFFPLFLLTLTFPCSAQKLDSIDCQKNFKYHQLIAPASLIAGGVLTNGNGRESIKKEIAEERNEHLPLFHTRIDDYLQFSPLVAMYALDIAGVQSKTDIGNRTGILLKSEILMVAVVYFLKNNTHQLRPDGSNFSSFPSGHTAQAFLGAAMLDEEYKYRYKWMPYAAYGTASAVGIMRIMNNKHYISDVLLGAGIGILSAKIAYWTHQYKWGKKRKRVGINY